MSLGHYRCNQNSIMLAPGALFTVENPAIVQKWMANGTLPLIFTAQSIKSVLHESKLYEIPPVPQSKSQHGFILSGVDITLLNMQVTTINCGGAMCDGLNMYQNSLTAEDVHATLFLTGRVRSVWFCL